MIIEIIDNQTCHPFFFPMFPSDAPMNQFHAAIDQNMYHSQPYHPPLAQHHLQQIFHYPHHLQQQHNPQFSLIHMPSQMHSQQPQPQTQPPPLPHLDLAQTLTQLADGQRELFETMRSLNAKIDSAGKTPITSIDQLASNLSGINLNKQAPPHQNMSNPNSRPAYVLRHPVPSRVSLLSEGSFSRDRL